MSMHYVDLSMLAGLQRFQSLTWIIIAVKTFREIIITVKYILINLNHLKII